MIRASAPGKLMLAGEYTVVDPGGPAIAVSLDVYAHVSVTLGGKKWRVSSAALDLDEADLDAVPVVKAVFDAVSEASEGVPEGGLLEIDSKLGVGANKYGLGASSAIAVAAMGALHSALGLDPPELDAAVEAHRASQRGRGSGYDVATALLGGVCLVETSASGKVSVKQVAWPEGLFAVPLFTGHGASSSELLARVESWRKSNAGEMERMRERLSETAYAVAEAWKAGEVEGILDAIVDTQEALLDFDRTGGIGIRHGRHGELLAVIEDAGAIARTSGAGGGDCAWALSDDEAALEAAVAAAEQLGFTKLDVSFPAGGLELEVDAGDDAA